MLDAPTTSFSGSAGASLAGASEAGASEAGAAEGSSAAVPQAARPSTSAAHSRMESSFFIFIFSFSKFGYLMRRSLSLAPSVPALWKHCTTTTMTAHMVSMTAVL